jgi:hypothetical protein
MEYFVNYFLETSAKVFDSTTVMPIATPSANIYSPFSSYMISMAHPRTYTLLPHATNGVFLH